MENAIANLKAPSQHSEKGPFRSLLPTRGGQMKQASARSVKTSGSYNRAYVSFAGGYDNNVNTASSEDFANFLNMVPYSFLKQE